MRTTVTPQVDTAVTTLWRCGGRDCGAGECEHEENELHRHASGPGPRAVPGIVHEVLASSGTPLPDGVRRDMASRLGHDFAAVRIHTGAQADAAADSVQAHAFTVGQRVVFGRGQFDPASATGRSVLAHELVHTVQQRHQPRPAAGSTLAVSDPESPAERQAAGIAESATRGSGTVDSRPMTSPPTVSRLPFGISLPGGARPLSSGELTQARSVYGSSIDYGVVVITDATGGGGRPFTTVLPLGFIALNLGPSAYASPGSNRDLLIHELAHVWQSQHHPVSAQFMVNSVLSQGGAAAAGGDAYCYVPGTWFGSYAAEQIAEQAEDGVSAVTSHMSAASAGSTDVANIASLAVPRWETRGTAGVVCP